MNKKIVSILITGSSIALVFMTWGQPESYGWIVAATGWLDKCFKE